MGATRQMRRYQERMAKKGKPVTTLAAKKLPTGSDERLVACALIRDGETHHGFRSHSDLRASLGDADPYTAKRSDEYGFWTSKGRFVCRREGNDLAARSGQCPHMEREMLSSDVNWSA